PLVEVAAAAAHALAAAGSRLAATRDHLDRQPAPGPELVDATTSVLRAGAGRLRDESAQLNGQRGLALELTRLDADILEHEQAAAASAHKAADNDLWLGAYGERRRVLVERFEVAQRLATLSSTRPEALRKAEQQRNAAELRDELRVEHARAHGAAQAAATASVSARERWIKLRERRLAGIAAEL